MLELTIGTDELGMDGQLELGALPELDGPELEGSELDGFEDEGNGHDDEGPLLDDGKLLDDMIFFLVKKLGN